MLLAGTGLAACGGDDDEEAVATLRAAVERTVDAESFHFDGRGRLSEPAGGDFRGDYNAPDRSRVETRDGSGEIEAVTIRIGTTVYTASGPDAEQFVRAAAPAAQGFVVRLLEPLRRAAAATAAEIDQRGDRYVVVSGDGDLTITVKDGYVRRVVDAGASGSTVEFSRFDEAARVDPPPADRVIEPGPAVEEPGGRGTPADLPPPEGDTTTTLQFRPVDQALEGGCESDGENPAAAAPAKLPGDEDECFAVEAAEVEIVRAERIEARNDGAGGVYLEIEMSEDDGQRFDTMARRVDGGQIAVVGFGRVLSAPLLAAADYGGEITVTGISPALASRLVVALR